LFAERRFLDGRLRIKASKKSALRERETDIAAPDELGKKMFTSVELI
jgi:hypothetical protein